MRLDFSICRGVSSTRGILENQPGFFSHCSWDGQNPWRIRCPGDLSVVATATNDEIWNIATRAFSNVPQVLFSYRGILDMILPVIRQSMWSRRGRSLKKIANLNLIYSHAWWITLDKTYICKYICKYIHIISSWYIWKYKRYTNHGLSMSYHHGWKFHPYFWRISPSIFHNGWEASSPLYDL